MATPCVTPHILETSPITSSSLILGLIVCLWWGWWCYVDVGFVMIGLCVRLIGCWMRLIVGYCDTMWCLCVAVWGWLMLCGDWGLYMWCDMTGLVHYWIAQAWIWDVVVVMASCALTVCDVARLVDCVQWAQLFDCVYDMAGYFDCMYTVCGCRFECNTVVVMKWASCALIVWWIVKWGVLWGGYWLWYGMCHALRNMLWHTLCFDMECIVVKCIMVCGMHCG